MPAHLFDIDGTIVYYHTNRWLPGAKQKIIDLFNGGCDIVFITMRNTNDADTEWSIKNTKETILRELDNEGVQYQILFDVSSPRFIHDDMPIYVDQRTINKQW